MAATRLTRSGRVIKFIETFCRIPEGMHVGKPMRLEPFQKRFLRAVYDNKAGTRRAVLSIARKNGKSGLIAAILLVHLVGPEARRNSQIVSGAMSRDQAALVFHLAAKMIQLEPRLTAVARIVPSGKRLIGLPLNTEYRALAADGTTAQGLSPLLAILDEVGQVRGPRSDFIDAIVTSQGAHAAPLLIAISTQAPNDADLLSLWIDDARAGHDPQVICHLYAAPDKCALDDRSAWEAANPALGKFRDLEDVERQSAEAIRLPSSESRFRNLTLNQRVEAHQPFVSRSVWESCGAAVEIPRDRVVFAGLDLSAVSDLTAMIAVWRGDDDKWQVWSRFWVPGESLVERSRRDRVPYDVWEQQGHLIATPGASIDYAYPAQALIELAATNDVRAVAFDAWRIEQFKQALQREGAGEDVVERMQPFSQTFKTFAPAIDALECALLGRDLAHGGHPVLTMCAANVVVLADNHGNRKFVKQKSTGRIDGMVALAMAIGVTSNRPDDEKIHDGSLMLV